MGVMRRFAWEEEGWRIGFTKGPEARLRRECWDDRSAQDSDKLNS